MKITLLILIVTSFFLQSCDSHYASSNDKENVDADMTDTNAVSLLEDGEETESLKSIKKEKVLCECFLFDSGRVAIYDTVNGSIIDSIQNDYEMESFYTMEVFFQKNDWFRVRAEAIETESEGWILNNSYLGTYSRNYTDTLFVYSNPDTTSNIECIFADYFTVAMKVQRCENEWLKVEIKKQGKKCTGWVLQSMTCPSPYTTCN